MDKLEINEDLSSTHICDTPQENITTTIEQEESKELKRQIQEAKTKIIALKNITTTIEQEIEEAKEIKRQILEAKTKIIAETENLTRNIIMFLNLLQHRDRTRTKRRKIWG